MNKENLQEKIVQLEEQISKLQKELTKGQEGLMQGQAQINQLLGAKAMAEGLLGEILNKDKEEIKDGKTN